MPDSARCIEIFKSRLLAFAADDVWSMLRLFSSPLNWNPGVVKLTLTGHEFAVGCIRDLQIHDGKVFREQLTELNDEKLLVSYKMIDCPMPVWDYQAENRVIPVTASNQSLVVWQSRFFCQEEDRSEMEHYFGVSAYEEGLEGIETFLSAQLQTTG